MSEKEVISRETQSLRSELAKCHQEAARLEEPDFPLAQFDALQHFQRERLAKTYADLSAQPRYAEATEFFLGELYGGRDMKARDAEVERALPVLERTLPRRLRLALADAFRLQSLSLELDIILTKAMVERQMLHLDSSNYCDLYRAAPESMRADQINLIHQLALELDRAVRLPLVPALIRAMRRPAKMAGFTLLQAFLERGLGAFRTMRGAQEFADTIRDREHAVLEVLYHPDFAGMAIAPELVLAGRGPEEVTGRD